MGKMKDLPNAVAVLGDIVDSRRSARRGVHNALLTALEQTNHHTRSTQPLHVTVGDELQGIYPSMGAALAATHQLRNRLFGIADLRFGIGGGEVRIIDQERDIQDGSAWWLAREALDETKESSTRPGFTSLRTGIRDSRPQANPLAEPMARLADSTLARLRDGSRRSLIGLLDGLDNAEVATAEGISASANSQRVNTGELRVLADALQALHTLP